MRKTGWANVAAHLYYLLGAAYYAYKWLFVLGIGGLIPSLLFARSHVVISASGIPLSVMVCLIAAASWRRKVRLQFQSLNPALRIEHLAVEYVVKDEKTCSYSRHVRAKAISPTETYKARFHWSGDGETEPRIDHGASEIMVANHPHGTDDVCRVTFDRMIAKGELVEFQYTIALTDARRPIKPYLGNYVDGPRKSLKMRVVLEGPRQRWRYRKQTFITREAESPLRQEIEIGDACFEWHVKPETGYHYLISWEPVQA